MVEERVNTGGEKTFVYSKDNHPQLDLSEKLEIEEAYKKADKRKLRNKIMNWIIVLLILIAGYIIIKNFL